MKHLIEVWLLFLLAIALVATVYIARGAKFEWPIVETCREEVHTVGAEGVRCPHGARPELSEDKTVVFCRCNKPDAGVE